MKMDKGTLIRTIVLAVALVNQICFMFGKTALVIDEQQVSDLVNTWYAAGTIALTVISTVVAWFKNNYITPKGKKQRETLKKNNLTK